MSKTILSRFPLLLFTFLLLFSANSYAVIGLPENTARYGMALGSAQIDIDEPDGGSPQASSTVPINLIVTDWLVSGSRYWLELFHVKNSYQASETIVGQNIRHTTLRAYIQKNLKVSPKFSPWLGAGLTVSQTRYSTRHTEASDGYLLQKLDDRSSNTLGFVINAVVDWEVKRNWFAGLKADQTFNFGNNLNARGAAMYFLYLY